MAELKIYKTSLKALKLIGAAFLFVFLGAWLTYESNPGTTNYIAGLVGTCFFGLGIPIGLFQLFDKRPQIIINENGIWDRSTKQDLIKWEQILDAYPLDIYDQKFISIVSDNSFVFKKKQNKWAVRLNKVVGGQRLNIHLGQTNADVSQLTELIKNLAKVEKEDRRKIIQSFKMQKENFSSSRILKGLLYISISIALLLISLTGVAGFMTIMIIMGISAFVARFYWGSTENSVIGKYSKLMAWFGMINMVLCIATLKSYDFVSNSVGLKLSQQIDNFTELNSSYPTDFKSIKKNAELNPIEKIFANRVEYFLTDQGYEMKTMNLLKRERKYDHETKEWK